MVTSATRQERATASYTVTYTLTVDISHDATSGRSVESQADDIADAILDEEYETFCEDFPQVDGVSIDRVSIMLERN